jgi:hypothetical protein
MPLADAPVFSVIVATYGRGRFILPTLESVLAQDEGRFELIVVGDATTDDTEAIVRAVNDPRVSWINLPERVGSQSGPNNAGIAAARGDFIAYLGHDDIWEPFHLSSLHAAFRAVPGPDFAIAGCIFHPPLGVPGADITGLFTDDAAKHAFFFPPSSFAHRADVPRRIGSWGKPQDLRAPVDRDFLDRAAGADLQFRSTGRISVHKFTAAQRYLSYLSHDDREQVGMLAAMRQPDHAGRIAAIVADAQAAGRHLTFRNGDHSADAPGQIWRNANAARGLTRRALQPLGNGAVLHQEPDRCAYDWADVPRRGVRWSSLNPRPRLALPVLHDGLAHISLDVAHRRWAALDRLVVEIGGQLIEARPGRRLWAWKRRYRRFHATIPLCPDRPTIMTFHLAEAQRATPTMRGLGIGTIRIAPAPAT